MDNFIRLLRQHFWGILMLVLLSVGSVYAVKVWKSRHPGSMSVLESQAMDMTTMKPPVGMVPVATEVVHTGRFASSVTYTGSVAPLLEQVVYPRVEGYIKNLSIYNGDSVSAGQLIAVIDSPDLQSRVAEASAGHTAAASEIPSAKYNVTRMTDEYKAYQSELRAAESEHKKALSMLSAAEKSVVQREKEVKSAKADLEYWIDEIAREEKLLNSGAVSLQEYQAEKAQATSASAEYENKLAMLEEAKDNVEAARNDAAGKYSMVAATKQRVSAAASALAGAGYEVKKKAAMASQAKAMVVTASAVNQYRYVRAPLAGIVTKRYVSPGQFVGPSTAIAGIVQIDKVRLQVNVSDADINKIDIGANVEARFYRVPGRVVKAVVTSVSPQSDQTSRTALVEAIIPNPDRKLVPGDAVVMDITTAGRTNAINIPSSAIVSKDNMDAVWIVREGAAKGKMEYYCTMHPDVVSDKPGKCPKCHMDLVPRTSSGNNKAHLVMVTTGLVSGDRIEITSGLRDGDEVIYRGNTYLKESDIVFPTKWSDEGPVEMPRAPAMPGMNMEGMPGMDHGQMNTGKRPQANVRKKAKTYRCPMHHEITSTNPNDLCKLCGMKINELVEDK